MRSGGGGPVRCRAGGGKKKKTPGTGVDMRQLDIAGGGQDFLRQKESKVRQESQKLVFKNSEVQSLCSYHKGD